MKSAQLDEVWSMVDQMEKAALASTLPNEVDHAFVDALALEAIRAGR